MRLRLEADLQRDLRQRHVTLPQQIFGPLNPPSQQEFMGALPGRDPELGSEVHPAQTGDGGQVLQADLFRKIVVDEFEHALEPPFLK